MISRSPDGFLARHKARQARQDQHRRIVFGVVLGLILMLVAGTLFYLVAGANDALWRVIFWMGCGLLVAGVLGPRLLAPIERIWSSAAQLIGKSLLLAVLIMFYVIFIVPIGLGMRMFRGAAPFYSWQDAAAPLGMEGWSPKVIDRGEKDSATQVRPRGMVLQLVNVFAYFIRNRQIAYLPLLVVLLCVGWVMFFLQTSALAPFIYTLF